MKKLILIASFITLAFAGCTTDPFEPEYIPIEEQLPIQLYGSIDQVATTRVNDDGFCDGDAVGVYVVNYVNGESGTLQVEGNQADNVKYVFDETNYKWDPVKDVYFRDTYTHVDIIGYYPYANPTTISAYPFEIQKDQSTIANNGILGGYEASDFLWGKAEDIIPTATRINLKFHHQMAGVQVTLVKGNNWEEGEWEQVHKSALVTNTKRKSTIDLATGEITAVLSDGQSVDFFVSDVKEVEMILKEDPELADNYKMHDIQKTSWIITTLLPYGLGLIAIFFLFSFLSAVGRSKRQQCKDDELWKEPCTENRSKRQECKEIQ